MRPVPSSYSTRSWSPIWPTCQDVFDEESCRYFLNEIGNRIVPCYPFAVGIEEVYGMIVERYGLQQAADAMSILQELLEDGQNAGGFGDDGDIWRSWRHSWRHRNDDASQPFIPRVGSLVLHPPTSIDLRKLKAENFLRQQQLKHASRIAIIGSGPERTTRSGSDSSIGNEFGAFVPYAELLSGLERYIQPAEDVVHHTPPVSESSPRPLHTSVPVVSFHSWSQFPVPPSAQKRSPCIADTVHKDEQTTSAPKAALKSCGRTLSQPQIQCTQTEREPIPEPSDQTIQRDSSNHPVNVAQAISTHRETNTTNQKTRLENRQARLIDGKIFTCKTKQPELFYSSASQTQKGVPPATTNLLIGKNCISSEPHKKHRKSWFRGLRHIFQHRTTGVSSANHSKHLSLPAGFLVNSLACSNMSSPESPRLQPVRSSQPRDRFGLDGTSDSHSSGTDSLLDLNKPLPLRPGKSTATEAERLFSSPSKWQHDVGKLPSTASSSSTKLSTKSSKANFHDLTRDLLQMGPTSVPELAPIKEIDAAGRRSLGDNPYHPDTPTSWKSMSFSDSMPDRLAYYSPALPPAPLELRRVCDAGASNSTIPASRSAPVLKRQAPEQNTMENGTGSHAAVYNSADTRDQLSMYSVPFRGRTPAMPKAETKAVTGASPTESRKDIRSRSPIKKLLALGKYEGPREAQDDHRTPPKTPASTKKSSLRKWGEKIRYGFLTPDEEQLQNEDLLENHMNPATPPSGQSTFPVSLEPPTQAKLQSEIELYVTVSANRFLMREAKANRLSPESISKFKERWIKMSRPQVVEFHYDQVSQHDLIYANIQTVKFYGDAAKDPVQVQSTLAGWRVMGREMSVRTFCSPDSVLRKHLHDAHRVLELLGAPFVTFLAYESMQIKSLQMISQRQKERMQMKRGNGHVRSFSDGARVPSDSNTTFYEPEYTAESFQLDKVRLSPSPSPAFRREPRKATGAEGAIMSLPLPPSRMRVRPFERATDHFDRSKGGRLGKAIHEKPENLLL